MKAYAFFFFCAIQFLPVASGNGTFKRFVGALESLPPEKRQALADSFWTAQKQFPVVEDSLVGFVFREDSFRCVTVTGDFNRWNPAADTLKRVPGTDLCHLSKSFERDARLDYKFVIEGENWILDPRNPNTCSGGFGANSELAMPEYLRPAEILNNPDIPRGKLDTLSFHSTLLKNDRRMIVYLPPSYSKEMKRTFPCLYVNDGSEYRTLGSMCNVLNSLIHDGLIIEAIVVFVDPVNRKTEYWLNDDYIKTIADELVPWIDSRYRTVRNPAGRGILGASLGGLTALNALRLQPGVFGLCASQSGAFWIEDEKILGLVREAKVSNLRVYLDWGSYEPSIPAINVRMADILRSKGCDVKTRVWHEGHSWGSWRGHLAELLGFLFPARTPSR